MTPEGIEQNGVFSVGRSYIKAILCILAEHQPKSFADNSIVRISNNWLKQANSRNYHHFFPKSYLKKEGVENTKINHIANITIVDAYLQFGPEFRPAYMIDQSHNVKDPIEALLQSVVALQNAYARALLVDRARLSEYQETNDVLMAERTLTEAYETDVRPLTAEARLRAGGALDPVRAFRESGRTSAGTPLSVYCMQVCGCML